MLYRLCHASPLRGSQEHTPFATARWLQRATLAAAAVVIAACSDTPSSPGPIEPTCGAPPLQPCVVVPADGGGGGLADGGAIDASAIDAAKPNPGGPGPAPTEKCDFTADPDGFIKLKSGASDYLLRLPTGYKPAAPVPFPLLVAAHGCGDTARNFLSWGVVPFAKRTAQPYIGVSLGGRESACWDTATDERIMLEAIAHVRRCVYVDQRKIIAAGYSSGGMLAFRTALRNSNLFAGVLALKTGVGDRSLLAAAPYKFKIAHLGGKQDSIFAPASYQADWTAIRAAGFALEAKENNTSHDGDSAEWVDFLLPFVTQWSR